MNAQYLIAGMLIVCGAATAWAGPDVGTRDDGEPYTPDEKRWVRRFGLACTAVGVAMLVATILGYRAPPADGPGVP